MKNIRKIGAVALSSCLLLGLVGCGGKPSGPDNPGGNTQKPENTVTPTYYGDVKGTVHEWKVQPAEGYILKDGKTDYKILVAEKNRNDEFISFAVNDFKNFFAEATGAELEVVYDQGTALAEGKYLAIGETSLADGESLGATEEELGRGGFVIRTVNGSVVMTGANNEASMYAAYGWLEYELGFDLLYTDYYLLDTGVTEIALKNYEVKDVPDMDYRIQSTGWIRYDSNNVKRMRWTKETNLFIPADRKNATWHNTFVYLPKTTYQKDHPNWYAKDHAKQLCYTARGDYDGERKEMLKVVSDQIIDLFKDPVYKDYKWITFSIEDNQNCCACDECLKVKETYGADSAAMLMFLNDLAKIVNDWMNTEEGLPYKREDFKIFFFAYHATNAAPAKYDEETDTYSPINGLVCDEHVGVYFAETNGDYMFNLSDKGTANTFVGDNMRAWSCLTDKIYFWSYSTNFNYFLTPYNSFDAVQDTYKFAKENKTVYIMTQDQWVQPKAQTGWGIYKNWLHAKLGWDVNADVAALTDKFFDGYFGPASQTMRNLFNEWRIWAKHQTDDLGYKGSRSVYINIVQEKFWPQRLLEGWLKLIEKAYEDLEPLKDTDPSRYAELREHICIESISYRYLLLELYNGRYTLEKISQMKKDLVSDVQRIGMTQMKNGQTLETVFGKWNF